MPPFHLRCVSVGQGRSEKFRLSQSDAELLDHIPPKMSHPRFISVRVGSVLRQCLVSVGRCASISEMVRVRVAMH